MGRNSCLSRLASYRLSVTELKRTFRNSRTVQIERGLDCILILVHAFITSRIGYCNSLLYGQQKCILQRLQSVLDSAARLIHLSSRREHVTPLLIQFHWLPIEQRITLKLLSLHSRLFMVLHLTISLSS